MAERLGRAALGGAGATSLWQAVRLVLLALSIIVLARLLDPADYGLVAMVTAIIGVGELLRDMGLSMASVQARSITAEEKSNLFWVNTSVGFCLTILVYFLATPISWLYARPELVPITQVLALTFVINGIATQFKAQINRDLRFMVLGFTEALPQALGLTAAVWWATQGGGYQALVLQALIVAVGGLVLDIAFAKWWPGWFRTATSVRRFLGFGGALAGTQTIAYVSKNLDTVLLGLTVGTAPLGWYNRAYQIVVLPISQLTAPMSRVAVPVLSRVQDDPQVFARFLRTGQFFTVTLAAGLFGFLIGMAAPLVGVFLGPNWAPVAPILQVLAISGIFRALGQVPYWIFLSKGLAGKQFRFYLVAQPLVILGIVAGLPFGPIGVAVGITIGYALFWIAQMIWAQRSSHTSTIGLIWSALLLVLIVALPIAFIGILLNQWIESDVVAVLAGALVSASYAAVVISAIPPYRRYFSAAWRSIRSR